MKLLLAEAAAPEEQHIVSTEELRFLMSPDDEEK